MEYTVEEMILLCQIIDSFNLRGFNLFRRLEEHESSQAMQGLVEKGLIKEGGLTDKGILATKILYQYNQAKVYSYISDFVAANYIDDEYCIIRFKEGVFMVQLCPREELLMYLIVMFDELKSVEEGEFSEGKMSKETFIEFMRANETIASIPYTYVDEHYELERTGILYVYEQRLHHYNIDKEVLKSYPKQYLHKGIENIYKGG